MTRETDRSEAVAAPVKWTTIREDAVERGLFAVVDEAMIGRRLAPDRRRRIVGNIVLAVAKWRESFRDCGCWKTEAGYALCDWHERAFAEPRKDARAAGRRLTALAEALRKRWHGTQYGKYAQRDLDAVLGGTFHD